MDLSLENLCNENQSFVAINSSQRYIDEITKTNNLDQEEQTFILTIKKNQYPSPLSYFSSQKQLIFTFSSETTQYFSEIYQAREARDSLKRYQNELLEKSARWYITKFQEILILVKKTVKAYNQLYEKMVKGLISSFFNQNDLKMKRILRFIEKQQQQQSNDYPIESQRDHSPQSIFRLKKDLPYQKLLEFKSEYDQLLNSLFELIGNNEHDFLKPEVEGNMLIIIKNLETQLQDCYQIFLQNPTFECLQKTILTFSTSKNESGRRRSSFAPKSRTQKKNEKDNKAPLDVQYRVYEKIKTKIVYQKEVFENSDYPEYLTQVAVNYDPVCPFKLAHILDGKTKIEISQNNYFKNDCRTKFLLFIKPNSHSISYYDLAEIQEGIVSERKIRLEPDLRFSPETIPLITQDGQIFLINSAQRAFDEKFYQYDFKEGLLKEKAKLLNPKRKFAFSIVNGCIYLISGETKECEFSNSCEKYSIKERKWSRLADCQIKTQNSSVVNFEDRLIYKFGGLNQYDTIERTIECYYIEKNVWRNIWFQEYSAQDKIYFLKNCAAVTVSKNKILIFGGVNSQGFAQESPFLFEVLNTELTEADHSAPQAQVKSLEHSKRAIYSYAGNFNSSQVFVQDSCIHYLRKDKNL